MSYLVVLVVNDPAKCTDILDAWEEAGVPGVTILESTGLGRLRRTGLREDLPLMPSLRDLLESEEIHHRTLMSVVDEKSLVDTMIASAQKIIGDLEQPHTGFLFVVPVLEVHGMGRHRTDRSKE
jgi:nitrogen regulatory protein PII